MKKFRIREYDEEPQHKGGGRATPSYEALFVLDENIAKNCTPPPNQHPTSSFALWKIHKAERLEPAAVRLLKAPFAVCKELFLPIGYPSSVRDGYLEYQFYDSLQGLCSYLRGVLCSAQVLQAAGVGDEAATAWGAALTWALKDGMGMIGGLVFSYCASHLFDAHVKEFRLFADLINDVALTLDMLAPYFSSLLLVSSASTLCKTLCGMSAAATKANITQYFAIEGNMADLNAKESTQETLVSLIGMLCGVTLARWLKDYEKSHAEFTEQIQWTTFIFLTLLHVWANWKGVCILRLRSLNRERADVVLSTIYQLPVTATSKQYSETDLPTPDNVNESLVKSTLKMLWTGRLRLNARVQDILNEDGPSPEYLEWYAKKRQRYILSMNQKGRVQVCLLQGATNKDELQAFVHARLLVNFSERKQGTKDPLDIALQYGEMVDAWSRLAEGSLFDRLAKAGWDVHGRLYLGFSRRRTELETKED